MNDLEVLQDLRADVPFPAPVRLAAGRNRLLASVSQPPRRPRRRLILIPAGLVTAAAAGVVAVAIVGSGATPVPATTTSVVLASQVLHDASVTAAKRTTVQPGPHQWFDTKFVMSGYGQGTDSNETWYRFDGGQYADIDNGHLSVHTQKAVPAGNGTALDRYDADATPQTAYNALESLPSNPSALLAAVDHQLDTTASGGVVMFAGPGMPPTADTPAGQEFAYLVELLWNAAEATPPAAEAAVYAAMSTIPGVGIQPGITDVVGRPVIGVSANGGYTQVLLDPQSYQVIGLRGLSIGHNPSGSTAGVPAKGTVVASMAWASVTPVSGPGRR